MTVDRRTLIRGAVAGIAAGALGHAGQARAGRRRTVFVAGDSTAATYATADIPQAGWGQARPVFLRPEIRVVNGAWSGASSKSFADLGLSDEERVSHMEIWMLEDPDNFDSTRFGASSEAGMPWGTTTSRSGSTMWPSMGGCAPELRSCSGRPAGLFSSRSQSKPGRLWAAAGEEGSAQGGAAVPEQGQSAKGNDDAPVRSPARFVGSRDRS